MWQDSLKPLAATSVVRNTNISHANKYILTVSPVLIYQKTQLTFAALSSLLAETFVRKVKPPTNALLTSHSVQIQSTEQLKAMVFQLIPLISSFSLWIDWVDSSHFLIEYKRTHTKTNNKKTPAIC